MIIYDVCQCETCEKTYKGKFKMHMDGKVTCFDCTQPDVYYGLKIEQVEQEKRNHLLYNQLSEMLIKDLENLYPILPEEQNLLYDQLYLVDGSLNVAIVYYQYNPISLVTIAHEAAYMAFHYMIQYKENKEQVVLYQLSKDIMQTYMRLRLVAFTQEDIDNFWKMITREEMTRLKAMVCYV